MKKKDIIALVHEEISSVLHTTQEFTLKDTEKLVDKLASIGVLYTEEKEHELRETISMMKLVNMAREDIKQGRVKPAESVMKMLEERG